MHDLTTTEHRIHTDAGTLFAKQWMPAEPSAPATAPIVLFHDSLGSVALWREFPALLASRTQRTVIAYDRLGFGQSDPYPDRLSTQFIREEAHRGFKPLKDQLGIGRFVALGHSVGGTMAVVVAGTYREECDALITESAQTFVEPRTLEGIRAAKQAFAEPGQLDRLRRHHGEKAAWVLDAWTETWLSADFANWTLDDDLQQVHCPLLVLHGEQDEYGSTVHPQRIAQLSQGPATAHVRNWKHVPHREDPEAVLDIISAWLASVASGTHRETPPR